MNTLNTIFEWATFASVRASALVLVVLATQWLLKHRLPSRWRYALWLPVLAALLLPALPVLPSWMKSPATSDSGNVASVGAAISVPVERVELGVTRESSVPVVTTPVMAQTSSEPTPVAKPVNWRAWVVWAWIIGAVGVGLAVFTSFASTLRRMRNAALPVDEALRSHIAEMAHAVGLRRVPRILKSTVVASPAVCGLWRPCLLLNENFPQELSGEEADMVLCHELMHIRRGDLTVNALVCALLALHWWNPLLWLAFLRVRADREAACDAQVLEGAPATRRAVYGQTLLKLETEFPPSGLCLGFVGILQRGGALRERIHSIISQPELSKFMKSAIMLSIAILTVAGVATASDENPEPTTVASKPVKADAKSMFDPVVKSYFAGLVSAPTQMERALDRKYAVTEYEVEGLWETMGVQLFGLGDDQESELAYFASENGKVSPLGVFTFGGSGIGGAVVSDGALYFKYAAGSGIHRVILYKVSRDKDHGLTSNSLGIIERRPEDDESKQLAEKMKDVIGKLKPVKKGQSTALAQAPKIDVPKKMSSAAVFEPMVKLFLAELPDAEKSAFAKAKFSATELQIKNLWEFTGLQIFELTSGPDSAHEIFTLHSGELKKLPINSDHGFPTAVEHRGSVYFTSHSGSGISTTTLHELSRNQNNGFTYEALGVIAANPADEVDKEFVKKMQDVINKLKPVTKGESANAAQSQAMELDQIKDRVCSIKRGEEITVSLKVDGNRLLQRGPGEKAEPKDVTVKVTLEETTATPFPVSGDPTRPYLSMSNSSDKPLHFRALERLKGKKEFRIVDELPMTVEPGDLCSIYCWESGSEVEEVVLCQFTFAPK